MKAHIESYGCALNRGEALEFESILISEGWEIVDDPETADLNAIATCIVIETTEKEMIKRIKALNATGKTLVVSGCMVTALRKELEDIAPNAQLVPPSGVREMCQAAGVRDNRNWMPRPWIGTHCHTIPIATGCLGNCSYCITKSARGEIRSRPINDILTEISRIDFSQGTKELQLTAQDTAAYGVDIGSSLPILIKALTSSDFDMRIRIGMMNPRTIIPILDDVLDAYSTEKVFKFLHLPIQSASNRLLDEMGRGYSIGEVERIIGAFRHRFPGMTLSTDVIVGYPGETTDDHRVNLDFIKSIRPEIVNITRFSPRPGTRAAFAKKSIPGWIAKDRSREMTRTRFEISLEKNRSKLGRKIQAVVTENGSGGTMIARSDDYEQIIVKDKCDLGTLLEVEIIDCSPIHLIGKKFKTIRTAQ